MATTIYDKDFFANTESYDSAQEIIPVIKRYFNPSSIIDIGCGNGSWLKAWQDHGIKDVLGIDGDYVHQAGLLIDADHFRAHDLEKIYTSGRKFDLVTCLEVAEHVRPEFATTLVESIANCGEVILFSAAAPNQGGTGHYNEQFPNYWIELFSKRGFLSYDCLREELWENKRVGWWYRQNLFFLVHTSATEKCPAITRHSKKVLPFLHPEFLKTKQKEIDNYDRILGNPFRALRYLTKRYWTAIRYRLGKKSRK